MSHYIAPVDKTDRLTLERADNNGWIVKAYPKEAALEGRNVGAFSNAADMLAALRAGLEGEGE